MPAAASVSAPLARTIASGARDAHGDFLVEVPLAPSGVLFFFVIADPRSLARDEGRGAPPRLLEDLENVLRQAGVASPRGDGERHENLGEAT